MCVRASFCHVLKMGHQCGIQYAALNSFMDPFQSLKLQQIKVAWIFSLIKRSGDKTRGSFY